MLLFGLGLVGEYVGRIYQQVRDAAALHDPAVLEQRRGARARRERRTADADAPRDRDRATTSARRRLRLSQRRRALPARAARARHRRAARRHARRRSRARRSGSSACADVARRLRPAVRSRRPIRTPPDVVARVAALRAGFPVQLLLPADAEPPLLALPRARRAQHARLAAAALSRTRAGELGGAARRARTPARRCTTWRRSPTPATSSRSRRCRSCPTTRRAKCSTRSRSRRRSRSTRALPRARRGHGAAHCRRTSRAGSYFGGRTPEDGRIDWSQSAAAIHDLVRAVAPPYPGAFTTIGGRPARVLRDARARRGARPPRAGARASRDGAHRRALRRRRHARAGLARDRRRVGRCAALARRATARVRVALVDVTPCELRIEPSDAQRVRGFEKNRLEALADGIFAVALTLLVLDIKLPEKLDVRVERRAVAPAARRSSGTSRSTSSASS